MAELMEEDADGNEQEEGDTTGETLDGGSEGAAPEVAPVENKLVESDARAEQADDSNRGEDVGDATKS